MIEVLSIQIIHRDKMTKIINNSKYNLILSKIPEKPRRKYYDIYLIMSGSYIIFDDSFDITKLSLRFKK